MARYLTPAKIGLLALVELYVEETVPIDAILPVLTFITSHLIEAGPDAAADRAEHAISLILSIKDFEKLLGSYPFLMGAPGHRLWDQFLDKMWGINSLDALHEFIDGLGWMLAKTKEQRRREAAEAGDSSSSNGAPGERETGASIRLTGNSVFGVFIRRAQLEFGRLRFTDAAELWRNFVEYRQPTFAQMRRRDTGLGRLSFDGVLMHGGHEGWDSRAASTLARIAYGGDMLVGDQGSTSQLFVSSDDVERLLEFQIQQMQKYGNQIPIEIRHRFHDLLSNCIVVPSLRHYLTFLDAWRAGDYTTSFDYLHRYFDYTMQNRDRLSYQYALMNLAVLQADFGCSQEAVSAMLETVATARENRDMMCLDFALNWLFHFGRANPKLVRRLESDKLVGTGKETLAYLRVRAKESGLWSLGSSVLLSEAKLGLMHGESMATAIECLVRSSHIIVDKNMRTMFGSQLAMTAAVWVRLGVPQMAWTTGEIFLQCHAQDTMLDDELRFTCRLAWWMMEKGRYDGALKRLDELGGIAMQSARSSTYWHIYRAMIKLKRDLHHNNLKGAERWLEQLLPIKAGELDGDVEFTIDLLHIECLVRRGDLQAASAKVEKELAKMMVEDGDMGQKIGLMLWEVYLLEKCGRPMRGFSIAMRAASMAWRGRIMPRLYEAIGCLANMLTEVGEFEASAQLLTAILPRSLECESSVLAGTLYAHLADAKMGLAGQQEARSAGRGEQVAAALDAAKKSFDYWASMEDVNKKCEMLAKKAMMLRISGDMKMAARCAATYVSLKKEAEEMQSH